MKVLALIPARAGSKRLPGKNARRIAGRPLLCWSVLHALESRAVGRVIVSTDSPEYAKLARDAGAEVPFLRPAELAQDYSTDLQVFEHALDWLHRNEGYVPDLCVHLRPTFPVRRKGSVDVAVSLLRGSEQATSIRSVARASETPYKMWFRGPSGELVPAIPECDRCLEPWSAPGQLLPVAYVQTANIDAVWTDTIRTYASMTGPRPKAYYDDLFYDIDDEKGFRRAEIALQIASAGTPCTFCFDFDGVIATLVKGDRYEECAPRQEMIATIRGLHAMGHAVVVHTARGSATGKDWSRLTRKQLRDWGVPYDRLVFGKPAADFYIDDRSLYEHDLIQATLCV